MEVKTDITQSIIKDMEQKRNMRDYQDSVKNIIPGTEKLMKATNDFDIENTQQKMIENQYFQEHFNDYEQRMYNQLQLIDQQNKTGTLYTDQIKDFVKNHNLYRLKNQKQLESTINEKKFVRFSKSIPTRELKQFLPNEDIGKINKYRNDANK